MQEIGSGVYGIVYRRGETVVKVVKRDYMIKDIVYQATFIHPNIVPLLAIEFDKQDNANAVYPYYAPYNFDGLTHDQVYLFADDLLNAVSFLHGHGIVHGDIRQDNILVDVSGNRPRPLLTDFGFASSGNRDAVVGGPREMISLEEFINYELPQIQDTSDPRLGDVWALGTQILLWLRLPSTPNTVIYRRSNPLPKFSSKTTAKEYKTVKLNLVRDYQSYLSNALTALQVPERFRFLMRMLEVDSARRSPASEVYRDVFGTTAVGQALRPVAGPRGTQKIPEIYLRLPLDLVPEGIKEAAQRCTELVISWNSDPPLPEQLRISYVASYFIQLILFERGNLLGDDDLSDDADLAEQCKVDPATLRRYIGLALISLGGRALIRET